MTASKKQNLTDRLNGMKTGHCRIICNMVVWKISEHYWVAGESVSRESRVRGLDEVIDLFRKQAA